VLDAHWQALQAFGDPQFVLFVALGVVMGLLFGIVPGLSGTVAVAVLLPFMFKLQPEQGLPLLMAVMSVQFIGGSITAILLNIPGTGPNAATLIDGFPMAQAGHAGRALGAALTSCGVGSLLTVLFSLLAIPALLSIVMAIHSADLVSIILMGLCFIAVLGHGSALKGLISGGVGLLLGLVGFQSITGAERFTFGSLYMYDGVPLIPLAMGLFALPEMLDLARRGGTVAPRGAQVTDFGEILAGARDVLRHWGLCLRSSLIGFVCGLIPGVGAETATFIAYGQAKQLSRTPERFGHGAVEGVIAPESANDAKEGGALLTTLAIGIPGSSVYALVLGGMLMMGLTPGPAMLKEHLPLSLSLFYVIAFASVLGVIICLLLARHLARIVTIPAPILVPVVVVFVFVGTYAARGEFQDLVALLVLAVLGLGMKRYGYSRPALFLGFVLGYYFELYFFMALGVQGPLFFLRPISLTVLLLTLLLFLAGPLRARFGLNR
jgi:TctA family transporter